MAPDITVRVTSRLLGAMSVFTRSCFACSLAGHTVLDLQPWLQSLSTLCWPSRLLHKTHGEKNFPHCPAAKQFLSFLTKITVNQNKESILPIPQYSLLSTPQFSLLRITQFSLLLITLPTCFISFLGPHTGFLT